MVLDFRANQVRTNKIISSGSTGLNPKLLVYDFAAASSLSGTINGSKFITSSLGTDLFLVVSGGAGSRGIANSFAASLFQGDLIVSGNFVSLSGLSGSLQRLIDGTPYLVAGDNVTISTQSNGAIAISSSGGGGGGGTTASASNTAVVFGTGTSISGNLDFKYISADNVLGISSSVGAGKIYLGVTSSTSFPTSSGIGLGYGGRIEGRVSNASAWNDIIIWDTFIGTSNSIVMGGGNTGQWICAAGGGALVVSGTGLIVSGTNHFMSGNMYFNSTQQLGTSTSTVTSTTASIITGFNKGIFSEDASNAQRRLIGMTASNIILIGDGNNTVHLSSSVFDIYTASTRRIRVSNAGAVSLGALTTDAGAAGSLTLGNNTPIYWLDSGNTAKQILSLDTSNIIKIGESATNLSQVKFSGQTVGVYATLSRSYTLAMGDDEIGNALGKPVGTVRGADQPAGSVTNIFGAGLVIRPGRGTGTGVTASLTIQGTTITGSGTNQHGVRDVALFHGSFGMQLPGIASASLPAASSSMSGTIQYISDTGQLFLISGSTWKDISTGPSPTRIMVAGALSTYATSSVPAMVGQFEFNPTGFAGSPYGIYFRAVLSVASGSSVTGSVQLYNITSGAYVEIGGAGITTLTSVSSTPALVTSVNLRTAGGFYSGSSGIYEVRLYTNNVLSASTLGIAEMAIR